MGGFRPPIKKSLLIEDYPIPMECLSELVLNCLLPKQSPSGWSLIDHAFFQKVRHFPTKWGNGAHTIHLKDRITTEPVQQWR